MRICIEKLKDIVERIDDCRVFRCKTYDTLALRLDISTPYLRQLLRGHGRLTYERIEDIANILNVDYQWLLNGDDSKCPYTKISSKNDLIGRIKLAMRKLDIKQTDLCRRCGIMKSDFVKLTTNPDTCGISEAKTILATLHIKLTDLAQDITGIDNVWLKNLLGNRDTESFIGFRIKHIRLNKHLTQEKLAEEMLGVSVEDINNWESGNCGTLRENLDKLSEALGENRDHILYGEIVNIDKQSVRERLVDTMRFLKISERDNKLDFDVAGIYAGTFDDYDLSTIDEIAYELNIDRNWLLTGSGTCPYDNLLSASEYSDYVEMIRLKHGMSKSDVANALNMTSGQYTYFIGPNGNLSWHNVERICLVVGEEVPSWIRTRHYNNQALSVTLPIDIHMGDVIQTVYPCQLTADVFSDKTNNQINHNINELMYFHAKREKWFKYQSYTEIDQARMFQNKDGYRTVYDIMRLADIFQIPVDAIVTNDFWKYFITTARARLVIDDIRNKFHMSFPQFSTATGVSLSRLEALSSSDIHITYTEIDAIARKFGFDNGYKLIQDADFIQHAKLVETAPFNHTEKPVDDDKTLPPHMILTSDIVSGDIEITQRIKAILKFQNKQMLWFMEYGLTGDEYNRLICNPNKDRTLADLIRLGEIINTPLEAFTTNEGFSSNYISPRDLSARIDNLCEKFKISRIEFSDITKVDFAEVVRIEDGFCNASYDDVEKIAKSFGFTSVSQFISDTDYLEHADYNGSVVLSTEVLENLNCSMEFDTDEMAMQLYNMINKTSHHKVNSSLCKKILVEIESFDDEDLNAVYRYVLDVKKAKKYDRVVSNLFEIQPDDDITARALKKALSKIFKN